MTTATTTPTYEEIIRYKTSKKEMTTDLAILSWDESEMIDAEVDNRKNEEQTEEEVREEIYSDSDFFYFQLECLQDELTEMMKERNPECHWIARMENFGWRKGRGYKEDFYCDNGKELLQSILPKCDCTYYVFNYEENGKKGFAINNAHHDSLLLGESGEWYFILPT